MQSLVDSGIVKTIIVKDLSRFGRNYLDVGNYLEIKYPTIGVRFIAIQENVDTLKDGRKGYDNVLLLKAVLFANIVNIIFTKNVNLKITRNVNLLLPVLLTYVYLFRPFLVFQHIHKILGSI